jgi:hypothetical protein
MGWDGPGTPTGSRWRPAGNRNRGPPGGAGSGSQFGLGCGGGLSVIMETRQAGSNVQALWGPYTEWMETIEVASLAAPDFRRAYEDQAPRMWRAILLYTGSRDIADDSVAEALPKPCVEVPARFAMSRSGCGERRSC